MLNRDMNICRRRCEYARVLRGRQRREGGPTYHDAEAQAQRAGEERAAVLYPEVLFAGKEPDEDIDADDAGAKDTGCWQSRLARRAVIRTLYGAATDEVTHPQRPRGT